MLFIELTWPGNRKYASSENQTLSRKSGAASILSQNHWRFSVEGMHCGSKHARQIISLTPTSETKGLASFERMCSHRRFDSSKTRVSILLPCNFALQKRKNLKVQQATNEHTTQNSTPTRESSFEKHSKRASIHALCGMLHHFLVLLEDLIVHFLNIFYRFKRFFVITWSVFSIFNVLQMFHRVEWKCENWNTNPIKSFSAEATLHFPLLQVVHTYDSVILPGQNVRQKRFHPAAELRRLFYVCLKEDIDEDVSVNQQLRRVAFLTKTLQGMNCQEIHVIRQ